MASSNSRELSDQAVLDALRRFDLVPTATQITTIRRYVSVLLQWNQNMNLTGLSDPLEIVSRHFGESWFATKLVDLRSGRLADIGSGAGFPGLALKICQIELSVTLVEQNKKKAAFLSEVSNTLGLGGTSVVPQSYEDWNVPAETLDFLTARAIGQYPRLLKWSLMALKPRGKLILWLGEDESNYIQTKPGWSWGIPARVPGSVRRQILVGSPDFPKVRDFLLR